MIPPFLLSLGLQGGLKLSRGLIIALVLAFGGFSLWRGLAHIHALVSEARVAAIAERDAHWRAEIAASNAEVEKARAESAIAAAKASAEADQTISGLRAELTELEKKNVALPKGGACGLDAGRVRLLDKR